MIFDISTADNACKFIQEFFNITASDFIHEYIIECNSDFEVFWKKWEKYIESIDIKKLKYKLFHVTTNIDDCFEIKNNGILDLKRVLTEKTTLRNLLLENGVKFDINNKILNVDRKIIDIDYNKLTEKFDLSDEEKYIKAVSRKIYLDAQVNAFFFINEILRYGTIHHSPEFLMNLSNLIPSIKKVEREWQNNSIAYIVTFLAEFDQFSWITFYNNEFQYVDDKEGRLNHKKWLIDNAIKISFNHVSSEICAYMGSDVNISPDNIIDFVLLL